MGTLAGLARNQRHELGAYHFHADHGAHVRVVINVELPEPPAAVGNLEAIGDQQAPEVGGGGTALRGPFQGQVILTAFGGGLRCIRLFAIST